MTEMKMMIDYLLGDLVFESIEMRKCSLLTLGIGGWIMLQVLSVNHMYDTPRGGA